MASPTIQRILGALQERMAENRPIKPKTWPAVMFTFDTNTGLIYVGHCRPLSPRVEWCVIRTADLKRIVAQVLSYESNVEASMRAEEGNALNGIASVDLS